MQDLKTVALIPARMAASRFPRKMLADLCGKPVIQRTYEATVATGLFDQVVVVTDDQEIFEVMEQAGAKVMMSDPSHQSGSDRIAEAASQLVVDVVVNVQGDEPFVDKDTLASLLEAFQEEGVSVASLMMPLTAVEDIQNPNYVKVITDLKGDALYFSRSPIPYVRDTQAGHQYFRHIGVYGYRKETLLAFTQMPMTVLEVTEKLEQLRLLENGIKIRMVKTNHLSIGIDTPEDLALAIKRFQSS